MQIDINPEQFAASIAQAVLSALTQAASPTKQEPVAHPLLNNDASESTVEEVKRKRGRPRKAEESVVDSESVNEIIDYKPPTEAIMPGRRAIANTCAAKKVNITGKTEATSQGIIVSNRKIRFMDDKSVAKDDPRLYQNLPERVTRDPAVKIKLQCYFCRRDFEIYPGECPQAFDKMKDPVSGSMEIAIIRCDNCYGR